MIRYKRRHRIMAVSMALLAGYVDALGFLKLQGYFVSFMSGNSTQLGVNLGRGPAETLLPAILIASFVAGVVLGSLASHLLPRWNRAATLGLVAALLALAAGLNWVFPSNWVAMTLAIAMGAENTVFERDGEVSVGVTYMTGTLVKVGQRIVTAILGGDRTAWLWYLLLWLGLVVGAMIGALVYRRIELNGLWAGAAFATFLAVLSSRIK